MSTEGEFPANVSMYKLNAGIRFMLSEHILSNLMSEFQVSNTRIEGEARDTIKKLLEHNPRLDPDTLARAAFFVSMRNQALISVEAIRKLTRNGGKENKSWSTLIPIIDLMNVKPEEF